MSSNSVGRPHDDFWRGVEDARNAGYGDYLDRRARMILACARLSDLSVLTIGLIATIVPEYSVPSQVLGLKIVMLAMLAGGIYYTQARLNYRETEAIIQFVKASALGFVGMAASHALLSERALGQWILFIYIVTARRAIR